MTTGKPTPTPWALSEARLFADANGGAIGVTYGLAHGRRFEESAANASLIVRAVNEREGLMAALERAEAPHARGCSRPRNDPSALCSCGLDAILAAAKAP